jgi:hypothetical protein
MHQTKPYLKRDLRTLAALIVLIGGLMAALWYYENTQGLFTALADQFLTFD